MKKLSIILVLLLTAVWAYTCWYWYTCNIKGFCDGNTTYVAPQDTESNMQDQKKDIQEHNSQTQSGSVLEEQDTQGGQKLSASDVLFDPLPKEVEQEEENIRDDGLQERENTEGTQSGVVLESGDISEKNSREVTQTGTICEVPLVGPISQTTDNNRLEVERLEAFLISRGENLSIDGSYGNDDIEAVKRFQLEYKTDVLDPWGITEPTGYVGRTSISKINELACN